MTPSPAAGVERQASPASFPAATTTVIPVPDTYGKFCLRLDHTARSAASTVYSRDNP